MKSEPSPHPSESTAPLRSTTTRFLRLRPAVDVPAAFPDSPSEPSQPEPPPVPAPPPPASLPIAATRSQRMRLRLVRPGTSPGRAPVPGASIAPMVNEAPRSAPDARRETDSAKIAAVVPLESLLPSPPFPPPREYPGAFTEIEPATTGSSSPSSSEQPADEVKETVAPTSPAPGLPSKSSTDGAADATASLAAIRKTISTRTTSGPPRGRRPRGVFSSRAEQDPPLSRRHVPSRLGRLVFLGLATLIVVVLLFLAFRHWIWSALNLTAVPPGLPHVTVAVARLADPNIELPLSGTIEAFQQASIFARTAGVCETVAGRHW